MKNNKLFISLGSNIGNPKVQLEQAKIYLAEIPELVFQKASDIFLTEPLGFKNQPWFHNQIIEYSTAVSEPNLILKYLLEIENKMGRLREISDGPRIIDLDLLIFGDIISNDAFCLIPHPRMLTRAFVLLPLSQLVPDLTIPGTNLTVRQHLEKIEYKIEKKRIIWQS